MLKAQLTLFALYNFVPDLFNNLTFPEGIDRGQALDAILWECADLELVYSNPELIKRKMLSFSADYSYKWSQLYRSMHFEYNPIDNYDRTETFTEHSSASGSDSGTNGMDSTQSSKAFNESAFSERDKSHDAGSYNNSTSGTGDISRTLRARGNIGVTTTDQMITGFRNTVNFKLYEIIAKDFLNTFCVGIY